MRVGRSLDWLLSGGLFVGRWQDYLSDDGLCDHGQTLVLNVCACDYLDLMIFSNIAYKMICNEMPNH